MANGTIAFDTLSTSGQISGTAVSVDADYLAYGSAKAWCVTTSQATVGNTFNVSGGTVNGTGDYSYALSSALANANIAATGNPLSTGDRNTAVHTSTTTSYKISIFNQDGSRVDVTNATIVFGDLA